MRCSRCNEEEPTSSKSVIHTYCKELSHQKAFKKKKQERVCWYPTTAEQQHLSDYKTEQPKAGMISPLAPSHGKHSQVPSPHISQVSERLATIPSRSTFSSPQTRFCVMENAAVTPFALCFAQRNLNASNNRLKETWRQSASLPTRPHPTNNSFGHRPGNSSCARPCMGEDGYLL